MSDEFEWRLDIAPYVIYDSVPTDDSGNVALQENADPSRGDEAENKGPVQEVVIGY